MKMLLSILEGCARSRPTNNGTTRRSSLQVALAAITIFAAAFFIAPATARARQVIHKGDVVVVPLSGEVSPSLLMFLRRAEKAAEGGGASAMIFEMDTYGGRLDAAADIVNALNRSSAVRNGHNPDIGEAFMNKEKEVKIGDRVIHPKGTLLTLNAQEATQ